MGIQVWLALNWCSCSLAFLPTGSSPVCIRGLVCRVWFPLLVQAAQGIMEEAEPRTMPGKGRMYRSPRQQWGQLLEVWDPGQVIQPGRSSQPSEQDGQGLLTVHTPALLATRPHPPHLAFLGLDSGQGLHLAVTHIHPLSSPGPRLTVSTLMCHREPMCIHL